MYSKNNIEANHGIKKLKRWTILSIKIDTVKSVRGYAKKHGLSTSRSLSELVESGLKQGEKNE
jgi:hypothetical protein